MIVRHILDVAATNAMLRSPTGGVVRDMLRRGYRVEGEAKRRCPVRTGRLRGSIHTRVVRVGIDVGVEIGTDVNYALDVHNGTGIYGPGGAPVVPKSGGVLRFEVKGHQGYVFARSIMGQKGVPFLKDALPFARL
jgi:hypothetical protein